MEILLRNGTNINEKNVKHISVGETYDFEKKREGAVRGRAERKREGERQSKESRLREGAEKGSKEREGGAECI